MPRVLPFITVFLLTVFVSTGLFAGPIRQTMAIEADPKKDYRLHPAHGPWMIMVATLHTTGKDGETNEGKPPEEVAHDLVLELRQNKIPAYVYEADGKDDHIVTTDSSGREVRRKNLRVFKSVCVLAGNYKQEEFAGKAQQTLRHIKKLKPKCLQGLDYRETKSGRGPLAGAFLTTNPMMSTEDSAAFNVDPLTIELNYGENYSLFENKAKYTLVIATFSGKSQVLKVKEKAPDLLDFVTEDNMDAAGKNACQMAALLRAKKVTIFKSASEFEEVRELPVYVWHDESESLVTVGGFESADDPELKKYLKLFSAPPSSKQSNGREVVQAKYIYMDQKSQASFIQPFMPKPKLMRVPQKKK